MSDNPLPAEQVAAVIPTFLGIAAGVGLIAELRELTRHIGGRDEFERPAYKDQSVFDADLREVAEKWGVRAGWLRDELRKLVESIYTLRETANVPQPKWIRGREASEWEVPQPPLGTARLTYEPEEPWHESLRAEYGRISDGGTEYSFTSYSAREDFMTWAQDQAAVLWEREVAPRQLQARRGRQVSRPIDNLPRRVRSYIAWALSAGPRDTDRWQAAHDKYAELWPKEKAPPSAELMRRDVDRLRPFFRD